jgi:hypothetical protein
MNITDFKTNWNNFGFDHIAKRDTRIDEIMSIADGLFYSQEYLGNLSAYEDFVLLLRHVIIYQLIEPLYSDSDPDKRICYFTKEDSKLLLEDDDNSLKKIIIADSESDTKYFMLFTLVNNPESELDLYNQYKFTIMKNDEKIFEYIFPFDYDTCIIYKGDNFSPILHALIFNFKVITVFVIKIIKLGEVFITKEKIANFMKYSRFSKDETNEMIHKLLTIRSGIDFGT